MGRKRKEDLTYYMKIAEKFLKQLQSDVANLESLCKCRNIIPNDEVQLFMDFMKNDGFMKRADCMIYIYNIHAEAKKKWGAVSVANIFDFTYFCFKRYGKILKEHGVS